MTTKRKARNRRERSEAIKKEFEARERRRRLMFFGALALVVAVLVAIAVVGVRDTSRENAPPTLAESSGRGAASDPPWQPPADTSSRVEAAGLTLGAMGTAEHYHAHLDVLIDGKETPVPANIGVDPNGGQMSGLHTHTPDGVIHVEAGTKGQTFTLGQLFTQWDVRLTSDQIGSLATDNDTTLTAYVNGKKVDGNPAMIRLADRQQIALVYGPKDAKVDVPSEFDFDQGSS